VTLLRERRGEVEVVRIDNPPLNVVTAEVRSALIAAFRACEVDPGVRALVLTGNGDRAFSAGADLREEQALTSETLGAFLESDSELTDVLARLRAPVVAAVNGYCMGGGLDLALACDIRIASEDARFRAPGVRIGLVANAARLTKLCGPGVASDLVLTGRTFDGREAERLGVVSRCVPAEELEATALGIAETIATRAPLAVAASKRAIAHAVDHSLGEALEEELVHYRALVATADHKAALDAFFDRAETPRFEGR
jgi:enoyl-CoA hydratase